MLHAQGLKAPAIAQTLHAEGWRPPKRRTTFTRDTVRSILVRQGLWTALSQICLFEVKSENRVSENQ
jgi:hypothetical protein